MLSRSPSTNRPGGVAGPLMRFSGLPLVPRTRKKTLRDDQERPLLEPVNRSRQAKQFLRNDHADIPERSTFQRAQSEAHASLSEDDSIMDEIINEAFRHLLVMQSELSRLNQRAMRESG
jgi:hypothetical protein